MILTGGPGGPAAPFSPSFPLSPVGPGAPWGPGLPSFPASPYDHITLVNQFLYMNVKYNKNTRTQFFILCT